MRILLTNDDGIHASGLHALHEALRADHEVSVVAPETEMSAVGHAITLSSPLRIKPVRDHGVLYGYGVTGTPADCVKIGVKELLPNPPELVLSGINLGRNVGADILYSGTVSAATEAAFLGYQAAAISLDTRKDADFRFAAQFAKRLIVFIQEFGMRDGTALNVNIPALPPGRIAGVRLARQGIARFEERFERRSDPRGNIYYWLAGETAIENGSPDTDAMILKDNHVTITPIHYDLTCDEELERLRRCALPSWPQESIPSR
jgi:5'-nucleotidase